MKTLFLAFIILATSQIAWSQTDYKQAQKTLFELTQRVAARDNSMVLILGDMYFDGLGTEVDGHAAFRWYSKADSLDLRAKYRMMEFYYFGVVTLVDNKKVLSLLEELLAANYAPAIAFGKNLSKQADFAAHKDITKEKKQNEPSDNTDKIFLAYGKTLKEVEPEFPGGEQELVKYLSNEVVYPKDVMWKKKEGEVVVMAVIDITGKTTRVSVIKSVSPDLDFVSLRAVQLMPLWTPGYTEKEYDGKVRKIYRPFARTFSVKFKLPPPEENKKEH